MCGEGNSRRGKVSDGEKKGSFFFCQVSLASPNKIVKILPKLSGLYTFFVLVWFVLKKQLEPHTERGQDFFSKRKKKSLVRCHDGYLTLVNTTCLVTFSKERLGGGMTQEKYKIKQKKPPLTNTVIGTFGTAVCFFIKKMGRLNGGLKVCFVLFCFVFATLFCSFLFCCCLLSQHDQGSLRHVV